MIDETKIKAALDSPVDCDGTPGTLRDYLCKLLTTLWNEEEDFSGKRPFGNSGWQWDVYDSLVKAGVVHGEIDFDGYLDSFDEEGAEELVIAAIKHVFRS